MATWTQLFTGRVHHLGTTAKLLPCLRRWASSGPKSAALRPLFFRGNSRCSALISTSHDIFENLAFEDWLYENLALHEDDHLLLLWRNRPAVVIGKFQNPWAECSIQQASSAGVAICRRKSGGGTVYHDMGNINCSFFTHRTRYRRKDNLAVIVEALRSKWNVDVAINHRDDIILNGRHKVSGTAAKLGRSIAYHHCTLLVEADSSAISRLLVPTFDDAVSLDCSATPSTRASTMNLKDACSSITCEDAILAIVHAHARRFSVDQEEAVSSTTVINPADTVCSSGVQLHSADLCSWQWTFGRTPDFTVKLSKAGCSSPQLSLLIKEGIIADVSGLSVDHEVIGNLRSILTGVPLCQIAIKQIHAHLQQQQLDMSSAHAARTSAVKRIMDQLLCSFRGSSVN